MPIQTNCAQGIRLFHVPIPGTAKDAERLKKAFKDLKLRKGKIAVLFAKNPLVHGRIYRGGRILLQVAHPLPFEVLDERFWKIIGKLIARTKEPWWDFCELVTDWKPKRSHPEAHALSVWRVTRKGELRYLHYEDPELDLVDAARWSTAVKRPNKAPEPTTFPVTSRAIESSPEGRARTVQPIVARAAPAKVVAHL